MNCADYTAAAANGNDGIKFRLGIVQFILLLPANGTDGIKFRFGIVQIILLPPQMGPVLKPSESLGLLWTGS